MPRDFAQRKQKSTGIPRWVWIFSLSVSAIFAGFLWYLSQQPAESLPELSVERIRQELAAREAPPIEQTPLLEDPRIEQLKELKENTEDALSFYTLLQQVEVVVPDPVVQAEEDKPVTKYLLQAASFRQFDDADAVRAKLILAGWSETYVEAIDVEGNGTFYRVMLGPFDNRSRLNKAQDILARNNMSGLVRTVKE